jgi:hypothetical protein
MLIKQLNKQIQKLLKSINFELEFISYVFSIIVSYLKNSLKHFKLRTIHVVRIALQKIVLLASFQKSSKKHVSQKSRQTLKNSLKFKKAARKTKVGTLKVKRTFNPQFRKAVKSVVAFMKNNSTSWTHFKKQSKRKTSKVKTGRGSDVAKVTDNQHTLGQRSDVTKQRNNQANKAVSKSNTLGQRSDVTKQANNQAGKAVSKSNTLGQRSDVTKQANKPSSKQTFKPYVQTRSQKSPDSGTKNQQNPKSSGKLRLKRQPLAGYAGSSKSIKSGANIAVSLQHITLMVGLSLLGATAIVVNGLTQPPISGYSFDYVTDSRTNELIYFINYDGTGYISMGLDEAEKRLIDSGKREAVFPLRVLANCKPCLIHYNQETN